MSEYKEVKRFVKKPSNVEVIVLELVGMIDGEPRAREICDVFQGEDKVVKLQVECIDPEDDEIYHSPVAVNDRGEFKYFANYMLTQEERERWIV